MNAAFSRLKTNSLLSLRVVPDTRACQEHARNTKFRTMLKRNARVRFRIQSARDSAVSCDTNFASSHSINTKPESEATQRG